MIAEGAFRGSASSSELHGDQRKGDGGRIGQHMSRVGKQRQTAGQEAADDLDEHKPGNQDKSGDQAALARPAQPTGMIRPAVIMLLAIATMTVVVGIHIQENTSLNKP